MSLLFHRQVDFSLLIARSRALHSDSDARLGVAAQRAERPAHRPAASAAALEPQSHRGQSMAAASALLIGPLRSIYTAHHPRQQCEVNNNESRAQIMKNE